MPNISQLICLVAFLVMAAINCNIQATTIQNVGGKDSPVRLINKRQSCYNGPVFPDCCFSDCCRQAPVLGEWGPFCCRASGRGGC